MSTPTPSTPSTPAASASVSGSAEVTPYVPPEKTLPEFTLRAVVAGSALGLIFGASSLYLVLKVGMTVSASIPVAVLAITLFRAFGRTTILENNVIQTAGSAGESIAFGVGVTMPALMLLGFDMDVGRVMVVSVLGGILGILMMIPLRRAFIVRMHGRAGEPGKLVYPEGTACAEVLITGEKGGLGGATVFIGFGVAFVHQFLTGAVGLLKEAFALPLSFYNRAAEIGCSAESALLGVGYIIGLRTAAVMMAGAVLGYLVLAPAIATFGDLSTAEKLAPGRKLIREMSVGEIRSNYLLYIGAGCVTAAGIISMVRTLPLIVRSFLGGLSGLGGAAGAAGAAGAVAAEGRGLRPAEPPRTERDLPPSFVIGGSLALLAAVAAFLSGEVGWNAALAGAGLILVFGFLFVTVSSRLTGEIGSSSNPISGMTVATLTLTCLIFLGLGWTSPSERVLALSIAGIVCVAASNGGTTSQDLKTGFLVGGTPILQQWAIIAGALSNALVIGLLLIVFNAAGTVYSSAPKNLPNVDLSGRVASLTETESHAGQAYRVWRPSRAEFPDVAPGKYLVDDAGKVRFLVDPAVTGRLTERDDGSKVAMKFEAPKTQVMGVIINGVLGRELNWGLVLMGAFIAVALELCGVSSLAFAVGVYIPLAYSVPIFLGGLVRHAVDEWLTPRPTSGGGGEAAAIAATETSPGVLLASGFIAGGSLAGVAAAFLEFDLLAPVKAGINVAGGLKDGPWDSEVPAAVAFAALAVLLLLAGFLFRSGPTPPGAPGTPTGTA
jgi:putative OPT family oligopeptide transporter